MKYILIIFLFVNVNAQDLLVGYSPANQNYNEAITSGQKIGQSFASTSFTITSCQIYLKREGTGGTGNLTAKIYAHSGVYGTSSVPTGDALATSTSIDVTTLGISYQMKEFSFPLGCTTADATYYVLVLDFDGVTDVSNYPVTGGKSGNPHGDGNKSQFTDDAWVAQSSIGACFYIYGLSNATGNVHGVTSTASYQEY